MANFSNRELLGTEKISKLIPKMALPTIIAQLITTFYNLVDTYFVSQLGKAATAAVGVNNSIERAITMFAMLIGAGASSYIARLLGQRRDDDANRIMSTSVCVSIGTGCIILILGKLFLSPMVDFLGATPECRQYSIEYGTYVLYAAPFMMGSLVMNQVLRSEGASTYSMIGMGFGGILNCFLDPIFIFRMDLGVAGASMATAISKFVSFCILLWPYLRKKTAVSIDLRKFALRLDDAKQVVTIGMSSFLRSLLSVIATVCLNRVAGGFSTEALASISVASRIMMFPFAAVLGLGMGFQPVAGYNWGSKRYDRIQEAFRFCMRIAIIGGIILGAAISLTAKPLIGIFNTEQDPEIYRLGSLALISEALGLIFHVVGMVVNMFFAGIGKPVEAALASTARQGYIFIPLLFIIPHFFGSTGLCVTQGISDLLSLAVTIPLVIKAKRLISNAINEQELEKGAEGALSGAVKE